MELHNCEGGTAGKPLDQPTEASEFSLHNLLHSSRHLCDPSFPHTAEPMGSADW